MHCKWLAMGLAVASTMATSPVGAQASTSDDVRIREARARFEVAQAQFDQGNYALAADTFREVHEMMVGHPRRYLVLFNLGRCLEETGAFRQAAEAYQRYLNEGGASADNAAQVRARVQEMERRAALTSATPASADTAVSPSANERPLQAGPDEGLLVAALAGYGAGLAGFAVMGVFGGLAISEDADLREGCGATASCTLDQVADLDAYTLASDIGLGIGLAGAVAGTVLMVLAFTSSSGDESNRSEIQVDPIFADRGAGLRLQVRY